MRSSLRLHSWNKALDRHTGFFADPDGERQGRSCLLQLDLRDHRPIAANFIRELLVGDVFCGDVLSECHHAANVNVMNVNVKNNVNDNAWKVILCCAKI